VGRALLHDVDATGAADLARVVLLQRVAPQDVPGVEGGVVDAQRRAEENARQDPDVLDGGPSSTQAKWISPSPVCRAPSSACTTAAKRQSPMSQP
ncbi:MAG: hypothetical protein ACJ8A0_00880, partial [Microvirga sp.]